MTKLGPNTLTLTGANSYGGRTTVSAGTLKLNVLGGAAVPVLSTSYGGANVMGGELVFDYTGTSDPLALVLSDLENSYSNGWASGQIYSTTAASNGWALGYVDNGTTITVMPALGGRQPRRQGGHQRLDHRADELRQNRGDLE